MRYLSAPLRPVSDEHRHEPADYELEPNELAACPFCGGVEVAAFHHIVSGIPDSWHVECLADDCGCGTCHHERKVDAVRSWNQRASPATRPAKGDEQAVMVCPQCEGEGGYPDGLDEAACHTECTRCGSNGWVVDVTALTQAPRSCCARVERLEVALRGLLSSYIGTCRFGGRVISEIEQHHCVIDARAALGDDVG